MPLALEPDQTIEISLKCDESKPLETRPAFIVRFMSSRDRRRVREHVEAALAAKSDDDAQAQILAALEQLVLGDPTQYLWAHTRGRPKPSDQPAGEP